MGVLLTVTAATRDGRRLVGEVVELRDDRLVVRPFGAQRLVVIDVAELFRAVVTPLVADPMRSD